MFFCLAYIRGASGVMYGAGEEDSPLSIDEKGLSVVGNRSTSNMRTQNQKGKEEEQFGKRGCFHVGLCGRNQQMQGEKRKKLRM